MMLNGWSATSLPGSPGAEGPELPWWDPNLEPGRVGGGPRFWRYQVALEQPWALDDASKLEQLKQLGVKLITDYRAELERLADQLVRAGPVPA